MVSVGMSARIAAAIGSAVVGVAVMGGPAAAGPNDPDGPGHNAPMAPAPGDTETMSAPYPETFPNPDACATYAPPSAPVARSMDFYRLCVEAMRLAPTREAENAIKWGFARLGAPYSTGNRTTWGFDCSSFIARAYRAGGAKVAARNGTIHEFFPYFGYTGAYVPASSPINAWGGGYQGTNLRRIQQHELRPGDLIIQFNGDDPAKSAGQGGHAQIYLGGSHVIEAGGKGDNSGVDVGSFRPRSYYNNEWYFRYDSIAGGQKPGFSTALAAKTTWKFKAGQPGQTVFGNLTVTGAADRGHIRVFPCGPVPDASNSQFEKGGTVPIMVASKVDAQGNLCFWLSQPAHVIWDQYGAAGAELEAHAPVRKADTRYTTQVTPEAPLEIDTGAPGQTVMGTVAVLDAAAKGYISVFPCDADGDGTQDSPPLVSTLNYQAGQLLANFASVGADANGKICVHTTSSAHVLWDQVLETAQLAATAPQRLYDSRNAGMVGANNGHRLNPSGAPAARIQTGIPNGVVIANVTVFDPINPGYTTVYHPWLGSQNTSVNNFRKGQTVANAVMLATDYDGFVNVKVSEWTHVIWDQSIGSPFPAGLSLESKRVLDSRIPFSSPTRA